MRIVAGAYRGRTLVAPKGHSTRPTSDRARQSLFNVLEYASWSRPVAGLRVLDGFAGSGALGLEALSRGAIFCLFADRDLAARTVIAANLAALGCRERGRLAGFDMTRLPPRGVEAPFDLVFLDPPYRSGLAEAALVSLEDGGWLSPGALAVVERGAGEEPLVASGYTSLDERAWGKAHVSFLGFT
ncbi:MAG TPA: 16S rRNA (guanine(966)-N(2))-methyltransferase RsmD [Caulobacteraceae bacterium]|jgi:16S rRNA (guanine966-N2)-methyltransferase